MKFEFRKHTQIVTQSFLNYGYVTLVFCILFSIVTSCTSENNTNNDLQPVNIHITDDLGRKVVINETPKRIISLAPSITEIIYFIGAENKLVARTQACDYPEKVKELPIVSTYPLDIESIIKLRPDLVFSVDGIVNADQIQKLEELGVKVFFQKYETIKDINRSINTIGSILGAKEKASFLVDSLNNELKKVSVTIERPLQVLNVTWSKPIFIYGKDTPFTSKIEAAGGENGMKEILNSPYPEITREYILKMNPDLIIGNNFEKMDSTFFSLYPELKTVKAYKRKQIYDVDDNLMSRPSPRYIESILELKNILSQCE